MEAKQQSLLNVENNLANVIKNIESNLFKRIQKLENNVLTNITTSTSEAIELSRNDYGVVTRLPTVDGFDYSSGSGAPAAQEPIKLRFFPIPDSSPQMFTLSNERWMRNEIADIPDVTEIVRHSDPPQPYNTRLFRFTDAGIEFIKERYNETYVKLGSPQSGTLFDLYSYRELKLGYDWWMPFKLTAQPLTSLPLLYHDANIPPDEIHLYMDAVVDRDYFDDNIAADYQLSPSTLSSTPRTLTFDDFVIKSSLFGDNHPMPPYQPIDSGWRFDHPDNTVSGTDVLYSRESFKDYELAFTFNYGFRDGSYESGNFRSGVSSFYNDVVVPGSGGLLTWNALRAKTFVGLQYSTPDTPFMFLSRLTAAGIAPRFAHVSSTGTAFPNINIPDAPFRVRIRSYGGHQRAYIDDELLWELTGKVEQGHIGLAPDAGILEFTDMTIVGITEL